MGSVVARGMMPRSSSSSDDGAGNRRKSTPARCRYCGNVIAPTARACWQHTALLPLDATVTDRATPDQWRQLRGS
jgi:hypothetical protein